MPSKTYRAVEIQHRGGERVRQLTEGMSEAEELAFWRRETERLLATQRQLREERAEWDARAENQ